MREAHYAEQERDALQDGETGRVVWLTPTGVRAVVVVVMVDVEDDMNRYGREQVEEEPPARVLLRDREPRRHEFAAFVDE